MIRGIDISHWQGDINFKKVKADDVNFCIIKAGGSDFGLYKDKKFESNYAAAKEAGLNVGAYYFVGKNFRGSENQRIINLKETLKKGEIILHELHNC